MSDDDDERDWQAECFSMLRIVAGLIAEYSPLIEPDTPAGWALEDLRDVNHELLIEIENGDEDAAMPLLWEARALLRHLLRQIR